MSFSSLQFAAGAANGRPLFLPLPSWPPAGSPLFRSAVRSIQPAKQPLVFNQDGRFSLNQPLLFVATATNNCLAIGVVAAVRLAAFLSCFPQRSARETAATLQPRRPFFFLSRKKEKVGGKKKESFAYGKRRNAVRRLRRGKRRFILPTVTNQCNPYCRCAALHSIKS